MKISMKGLLVNKLILMIIGGVIVVGVGVAILLFNGVDTEKDNNTNGETGSSITNTVADDDFQRTGQYSFGLAVCEEMSVDEVEKAIGKTILQTEDYSNNTSTGCEYFVTDTDFVIIDVGYSDMEVQKTGLEFLDRTIKTDNRIGLENMLAYSENGLIDVYMNVAPGQKYVRIGRSSISAVDEETLLKLAIATEVKIRSYN